MTEETDWEDIKTRVQSREKIVGEIADGLAKIIARQEIASIDLFVEKAQIDLKKRSDRMLYFARLALIASIVIFLVCLIVLSVFGDQFHIDPTDWRTLLATALRNATFLGVVLGGLYFSLSLFRSFMHEGTTLQNRIHSTRLGRLFLYVKLISADKKELNAVRASLTASEMETVFGWNIETSTAFKDIDPHYATKTVVGTTVEGAVEIVKGAKEK